MPKVKDIISVIEDFAPLSLQESYDNAGLQVGDAEAPVSSVLVCLDVTEDVVAEADQRGCDLIVSHHPLLFHGLKRISTNTATERIVTRAIRAGISIYSAHTNLDSAREGISHEIANIIGLRNVRVLAPNDDANTGLGVIGDVAPTPTLEFLRSVKDKFHCKAPRYSRFWPGLVVKKVAVCGGAGSFLLKKAIEQGADALITGDLKYHDFTSFGGDILIVDIGHYESELCAKKIFKRILHENFPDCPIWAAESEHNPLGFIS